MERPYTPGSGKEIFSKNWTEIFLEIISCEIFSEIVRGEVIRAGEENHREPGCRDLLQL